MNALHDIRVVELGEGVALGYVGALLAACGADCHQNRAARAWRFCQALTALQTRRGRT